MDRSKDGGIERREFAKETTGMLAGIGLVSQMSPVNAQTIPPQIIEISHINTVELDDSGGGELEVTVETEGAATRVVDFRPTGMSIALSAQSDSGIAYLNEEQNHAMFSSSMKGSYTHTFDVRITEVKPGARCEIIAWVNEDSAERQPESRPITGPATLRRNADDEKTSSFTVGNGSSNAFIRGQVVSQSECPVQNATVRLPLPDDELTITTDSNGEYYLDLSGTETPSQVTLLAEKEGFITESVVASPGETANFTLIPGDESQVAITSEIHHLGDGNYDGSINSQFQESVEDPELTRAFELTEEQASSEEAELIYSIRGAQNDNEVRINGELIGSADSAPSDGSASEQRLAVNTDILEPGENSLNIESAENQDAILTDDIDDFEVANIRLSLIDPNIGENATGSGGGTCPSNQLDGGDGNLNQTGNVGGGAPTFFQNPSESAGILSLLLGGGLLASTYLAYQRKKSPKEEKSGHCPNCGSDVDPSTIFCGSCGAQLTDNGKIDTRSETDTKTDIQVPEYDYLSVGKTIETESAYQIREANLKETEEPVWVVTAYTEGEQTLDVSQTEEFLNSIEPWAKMDDHPNLLSVYGHGTEPFPWITIEVGDYPRITEIPDELSVEEKIDVVTQICEAVHHVRRYGMTYQNLSMDSIGITDDNKAKLLGPLDQLDEESESEVTEITLVHNIGNIAKKLLTGSSSENIPDDVWIEIDKALSDEPDERHETVLHFRDSLTQAYS